MITQGHHGDFGPLTRNADLARRRLVVVEGHGQAQIIRFCANMTPRSNRIPECAFTDISVP
jgi:hypothetical protein